MAPMTGEPGSTRSMMPRAPPIAEVGDELPRLRHTATPLQLFRYSAVTWNPPADRLRSGPATG